MKILEMDVESIHADYLKPEISVYDKIMTKSIESADALVLFTCIEEGDTQEIAREAMEDAIKFMGTLKRKTIVLYPFAHLSTNLAPPKRASELLDYMFSIVPEGYESKKAAFGWNKKLKLEMKGHPLAERLRSFPRSEHATNESLAVRKEEEPEWEQMMARIKKSDFSGLPETDHRIIGERLELFSFQEVSPGMVYWHNKGVILREILINFIRSELSKRSYLEVSTPALANTVLWRVSGHWDHYKDNMFVTHIGDEEFGLKPMNCPSAFLFYKTKKWSYRDLPLRVADFDQLYRNERSGVASGLFRVKILTQDDAHIFCSEEQIEAVISEILEMVKLMYGIFGLEYKVKLSTMPDSHIGSEKQWEEATRKLSSSMEKAALKYEIKDKEGAFYGPKIDIDIRDSIGREWQCATIQLDYQMPARFGLVYSGADGKEHTPITVHRVIYGSLERFIGIMLEHYRGKLPTWLSPVQVKVLSISEQLNHHASKIYERFAAAGVRAELDVSDKTLEYKIRSAKLQEIPYVLIIGKKEEQSGLVSIRGRDGKQKNMISVEYVIEKILEESRSKSQDLSAAL